MKRGLFFVMSLFLLSGVLHSQILQEDGSSKDLKFLRSLPNLEMPAGYALKSLPLKKDNTATAYFPEVFGQYGWSCNQASSIGYIFTYEINALRNKPATELDNLYPPLAIWNLLNDGDDENGVSFFDSWQAIKLNGVPNFTDFGVDNYTEVKWMTGYDKYYRGMQNRTDEVYTINTDTEEGINTLKHWLNDHLDGSPNGGVANIQIGSTGMQMSQIPAGEEGEGKYLMTTFAQYVGHALTVAGWNDDIRWDFNKDGRYTNDVDLNADGVIDVRDWENGAFLVINSWGQGWGDKGRVFVPYRLFAENNWNGGIWEKCVTVVRPKKEYAPQLTYKVALTYTKRNQLKIVAGISQNTSSDRPEYVLEYPFFNHIGGALPMQGTDQVGAESIEFGLDVSPLLAHIDPALPAKFFLEVYHQQGGDIAGTGKVNSFKIVDYGSGTAVEQAAAMVDENIRIDALTRLFVVYNPTAQAPQITMEQLPQAEVGKGYITSLTATGGQAPYTWSSDDGQYVAYKNTDKWTWPSGAQKIIGINDTSRMEVNLGFSFDFYGQSYDKVIVLKDGGLVMGDHIRDYPYVVDPRLFVFQNAGIYPFYRSLEYKYMSDGVYRKDVSDGVIFAWDASISHISGVYDPKFGLKISKNGAITIMYQVMALGPDWDWIAGVSAGDQLNFTLPDNNALGLMRGDMQYNFKLFEWPEWLFFSPSGALLGTPPSTASSMWLPLRVADKNGISSMKFLFLDVKGGTGTGDIDLEENLKVYPNPAHETLFLDVPKINGGEVCTRIYSIQGQEVYKLTQPTRGNETLQLNLSLLKEGIYLYQIEMDGQVRSGKLILKR